MAEHCDEWATQKAPNLWGTIPSVEQMQSEAGVIGAIHGAIQVGSLATTFTSSQGLLLMIPNMYKIAGELTPLVIHVAARSIACQALSIFGDHSDVMAARATGFAMLASTSVQEAMDFALIAQSATLEARIPFLHFFDGFRTSHELAKIEVIENNCVSRMISESHIRAHRSRALNPEHPVIRGTAQNPDVFFQARESVNSFYNACPTLVQNAMDLFFTLTQRKYSLFEYTGSEDAERVIVIMGSAVKTVQATVTKLLSTGEKVGVVAVRLYRPFSTEHFIKVFPESTKAIAVLDRTKEPGSIGEPLLLDVSRALMDGWQTTKQTPLPKIIGGRYGLSSKEFTPQHVAAIFCELCKSNPQRQFTVGINDDITFLSIPPAIDFRLKTKNRFSAIFYGLGSDGTVSACKNTIKIIGENTHRFAQGYFVYDSKKSGSVTISHMRVDQKPIDAPYLITRAQFVACHQFQFLDTLTLTREIAPSGTFLVNCPHGAFQVWKYLPNSIQQDLVNKHINFFVIDADAIARKIGLRNQINTIMQAAFFALSKILPVEEAVLQIKALIEKSYARKGQARVAQNMAAVDAALESIFKVEIPEDPELTQTADLRESSEQLPFIRAVTMELLAYRGDQLPVSVFPPDGTYPTATSQFEKRTIAKEIPVWDESICIQCGKCVAVCPHSAIRAKVFDLALQSQTPPHFQHANVRTRDFQGGKYTLQISPRDCTGCELCVEYCPVNNKKEPPKKALNMAPIHEQLQNAERNWTFFQTLPEVSSDLIHLHHLNSIQYIEPLFEFSGACAGCGETPYLKLLSQLFGDRLLVANATGCSSIFGGNLPTTPWTKNRHGQGPAWANSLFEDNAEFGFGFALGQNQLKTVAIEGLKSLAGVIGDDVVDSLLQNDQTTQQKILAARETLLHIREKLTTTDTKSAKRFFSLADWLIHKSIWIVGGDGWAYDIDFGGLDHVLSTGANVNVLILDTEVYSNTGGQSSKSTPLGAIAKFAQSGKVRPKKDLPRLFISYQNVYVATVALGASDAHTLKTFLEAEAYPGPSVIIAYSHCISHGIAMNKGLEQQKKAVEAGVWPLLRFNPANILIGKNPLTIDSPPPKIQFSAYALAENRYRDLLDPNLPKGEQLRQQIQEAISSRWKYLQHLEAFYSPTKNESSK
jgi:pyruvate-ferredoxin/flavodoxin oxidoreductase